MTYSPNKIAGQWRAHGRYIARESVRQGPAVGVFGNQIEGVGGGSRWVAESWRPRLWKMIISPEFGERIDLNQLTRELMSRMEDELGTRLEWVGVPHFNTEHPHVHVALGLADSGSAGSLQSSEALLEPSMGISPVEKETRGQLDALHADPELASDAADRQESHDNGSFIAQYEPGTGTVRPHARPVSNVYILKASGTGPIFAILRY